MHLLNSNQLSLFKRKAYERYLKNKAASGDKTSKEILNAKKWYTSEKGIVDQSARNVLAKRTKAADTYKQSIIRGGFVKGDSSIPRKSKSQVTLTGKYKGQSGSAIKEKINTNNLEKSKKRLLDSINESIKDTPRIKLEPKETPKINFKPIADNTKSLRRNKVIGKALIASSLVIGGSVLAGKLLNRKTRKDKNKKRGKYNKKN